ncbi:hypothetical protein T03_2929 [Trichinella britovi]|uniref:Uncharacterized protein n=1 Tax=Trichinella britovi TaxID=45882 RepID=A0A0V1AJS2_TRIBR|nr:hypothetical protein T03_6286 [Trichinella britovi]KRY25722.1 hypothetical protein T03_2929 [Trichinella britovi]
MKKHLLKLSPVEPDHHVFERVCDLGLCECVGL